MKTLFKSKIALLIVFASLSFSCKKNDNAVSDDVYTDSTATETTIDTTGTYIDSTSINSGAGGPTGTTGTTGSTGSGTTDSINGR